MYGIDNNYNPKQKYEKTKNKDLSLIIWREQSLSISMKNIWAAIKAMNKDIMSMNMA